MPLSRTIPIIQYYGICLINPLWGETEGGCQDQQEEQPDQEEGWGSFGADP